MAACTCYQNALLVINTYSWKNITRSTGLQNLSSYNGRTHTWKVPNFSESRWREPSVQISKVVSVTTDKRVLQYCCYNRSKFELPGNISGLLIRTRVFHTQLKHSWNPCVTIAGHLSGVIFCMQGSRVAFPQFPVFLKFGKVWQKRQSYSVIVRYPLFIETGAWCPSLFGAIWSVCQLGIIQAQCWIAQSPIAILLLQYHALKCGHIRHFTVPSWYEETET